MNYAPDARSQGTYCLQMAQLAQLVDKAILIQKKFLYTPNTHAHYAITLHEPYRWHRRFIYLLL